MTTLYFRAMVGEDDRPKIGRSGRLLGIRPGIDIDTIEVPDSWIDPNGYLRLESERGESKNLVTVAVRNTKGMSASISIESLPSHRKPIAWGGTGRDLIWQIDSSYIDSAEPTLRERDLEAVRDSPTHVSIMPRVTMLLAKYELALANTQKYWQRVEN
ncbi:hypothetical protein [Chamaesiphon minutus]|jgi:hypothetical protein|uniref:Tse2 ADP-ribosyltransferase toxin domain-containing protein n=1 Tax=Chamaesiphon minutus (strain ATCC 27169 / PCC 6605) TaxID=1173020 RepID=K9UER6_CHAP6|nr:hypothetical protein [Chamaesiphon minutus]AFY93617.1 hypothetical protein Cha6605_2568 [Chamaesiphon minutus PCC 6605]